MLRKAPSKSELRAKITKVAFALTFVISFDDPSFGTSEGEVGIGVVDG
jgi:hypothetical protein